MDTDTMDARVCDECFREWRGKVPTPTAVHVWLCPWCETRLSGRSVVWRQGEGSTWTIRIGHSDDWPWRGPLVPVAKDAPPPLTDDELEHKDA